MNEGTIEEDMIHYTEGISLKIIIKIIIIITFPIYT